MSERTPTADELLEEMRGAYVQDGARRFWPQEFVAGGRSRASVLRALRELQSDGFLECRVRLKCPEDHTAGVVEGCESRDEIDEVYFCEFCGASYASEELAVFVQFELTEAATWEPKKNAAPPRV